MIKRKFYNLQTFLALIRFLLSICCVCNPTGFFIKSILRNKDFEAYPSAYNHSFIISQVFLLFRKMSLLILADSQIERVWRSVRQDREILKTAEFVPVKRFNQMHDGFKAMKATVRLLTD